MKESANDMCYLVILTVKDIKLLTLRLFTEILSLAYLNWGTAYSGLKLSQKIIWFWTYLLYCLPKSDW